MSDLFIDLHPDNNQWGHHYFTMDNGERLHYVRQGKGKSVILLHGWPGFWYDWRRVLPNLSKEADVICPDFLGFGNSDKPNKIPQEAYTPEAQAHRIIMMIRKLNLYDIVLVGYDIGARIAQTIIKLIPDRFTGLVLCNPSYPGIGDRRFQADAQREFWYQHLHNIPNGGKLIGLNREATRLYLEHFYTHWVGKKDALRPKEFDAIVDVYARDNGMERSITWYQAGAGTGLAGNPTINDKTVINNPTIILWGEKDPIFPAPWSDRLSDFFSNYRLFFLNDVGHFAPFEAPEEIINAIRLLRSENLN